jgi:hypothetical protein
MGTTRFFTGTAIDGTRYDFVEETPDRISQANVGQVQPQGTPRYRLSRDGSALHKTADREFTIVRSGVRILVQ